MAFVEVKVRDAYKEDIGRGIIRVGTDLESELNLGNGDIIKLWNPVNGKETAAKLEIGNLSDKNSKIIRIDSLLRRNLGIYIGDFVEICKIEAEDAEEVVFINLNPEVTLEKQKFLVKKLESIVITKDDIFSFRAKGHHIDLIVFDFSPKPEAVLVSENTIITIHDEVPEEENTLDHLYSLYRELKSELQDLRSKIMEIKFEIDIKRLYT